MTYLASPVVEAEHAAVAVVVASLVAEPILMKRGVPQRLVATQK